VDQDYRIWDGQASNNNLWWNGQTQQNLFQPGQMVYAQGMSGILGGGLGTAIGNFSVTSTTAIA